MASNLERIKQAALIKAQQRDKIIKRGDQTKTNGKVIGKIQENS